MPQYTLIVGRKKGHRDIFSRRQIGDIVVVVVVVVVCVSVYVCVCVCVCVWLHKLRQHISKCGLLLLFYLANKVLY